MLWAPRPAFRRLRLERASATSARASPTFFDFAGPVPTAASPEATIAPMSAARMRGAVPAGPHVHLLLVVVEPLVAGVALDLEGLDHLDLAVPDLLVAFQALDRVAGDVDPVEGERVGLPVQPAHVAVVAMGVVDPAVPLRHAGGALLALHPDLQVGLVGEPEAGAVHGPGGGAG